LARRLGAADGDTPGHEADAIRPAAPRRLRRKSRDEVTLLEVPVEGDYDREKAAEADVLVYNVWGRQPSMIAVRTWSMEGEHFRVVARALGPDQPIYSLARGPFFAEGVAGTHWTIFDPEHIASLAPRIDRVLRLATGLVGPDDFEGDVAGDVGFDVESDADAARWDGEGGGVG
jgi:hypothetical protein